VVLTAFLALLLVGCAPAPAPANLLVNGGFEGGAYDGTGITSPRSWQRELFRPWSELSWDDTVAYSGAHSIKIVSPAPNDVRWIQTVTVEPDTVYELSGYIRTEDVGLSEQAVSAGANLSVMGGFVYTQPVLGTSDWTYRSLRFNSGSSTTVIIAARVGFYSGISAGTAWFDQVRLRPVPG
jgi:hypothetical protein